MLKWVTVILACQLAGEFLIALTGLPLPGPVVGMLLLFGGLLRLGRVPVGLSQVGDTLLSHLSLLFVPAGTGIVVHAGLIATEIIPLAASLLVSTLVTIAVTGLAMSRLNASDRDTVNSPGDKQ